MALDILFFGAWVASEFEERPLRHGDSHAPQQQARPARARRAAPQVQKYSTYACCTIYMYEYMLKFA